MSTLAIDYFNKKTSHSVHLPVSVFKKPVNAKEYNKLQKVLDSLIDEVRDDEMNPLALVMEIIGDNLEQYDNENHPTLAVKTSDIDFLKYLMKSQGLAQKDLAGIFGSQGNVSKFLSGERSLSKNQILGLKGLFNISADFFIDCQSSLSKEV